MLLSSLLLLTFLLSDSGNPAAVDIHDVLLSLLLLSSLLLSVSLHTVTGYTTFASIPAFASVSTVLAGLLLLSFLLFAIFSIAVIIAVDCCWLPYCCLHSCCWLHYCCCWHSFILYPDIPTVATVVPRIVGVAAVALVPACFLAFTGVLVIASIPADPGVPILAGLLHTILHNVHCTVEQIRVCLTIGFWLANCSFFLLSYYRNIQYHTGSKKLSVANLW